MEGYWLCDISCNIPDIHIDIKYFVVHFMAMRCFFSDIQWHLAGCFDRQLQNVSIQKRRYQMGMFRWWPSFLGPPAGVLADSPGLLARWPAPDSDALGFRLPNADVQLHGPCKMTVSREKKLRIVNATSLSIVHPFERPHRIRGIVLGALIESPVF
jgi:hypothetical protein